MKFDIAVPEGSLTRRLWQFLRRVTSESPALEAPDESRADLLAHLIDRPDDSRAWYELAVLHAECRDRGWAFLAAAQADRLDPEWRQPAWLMADCLARSGMAAAAVRLIEDRGWLDRGDSSSVYAVARLAVRAGDADLGLPLLDEVLAIDPDHPEAVIGRLQLLRLDRPEEADAYASELAKRESLEVTRALATDRIRDRDPMRALEYLSRLPDDSETHTLRSRAYLTIGRYSTAMEEARRALHLDPSNRTAAKWLDESTSELRLTQLVPVPISRRVERIGGDFRRVLHFVSAALPDVQAGYTIRSQAIGEALQRVGWEVHFTTPPERMGPDDVVPPHSVSGVTYHRLPLGSNGTLPDRRVEHYGGQASRLVEVLEPTVLHAHSGFTNGAVALGLRDAFGVPMIYEARGFLEDTWLATEPWADADSDRYVWRRNAETRCMELADAVVTLGEAMRDEIEARGIDPGKISVIPNAVDPTAFTPGPSDPRLREELGFDDEVVVGYVSSLRRLEGVGYLVAALARLRSDGQSVKCLIVGDGPERGSLESSSERLGIRDSVVFTGSVPHSDVKRYYKMIDVFVVPRTSDRVNRLVTPLKPLEAMAMAKPVVAASLPALREMVVEGVTGVTFAPDDPEDLAERLSELVVDEARRNELGRKAREWVIQNRTWDVNARRYGTLYDDLLGGR